MHTRREHTMRPPAGTAGAATAVGAVPGRGGLVIRPGAAARPGGHDPGQRALHVGGRHHGGQY
jgi:hypothetical protein